MTHNYQDGRRIKKLVGIQNRLLFSLSLLSILGSCPCTFAEPQPDAESEPDYVFSLPIAATPKFATRSLGDLISEVRSVEQPTEVLITEEVGKIVQTYKRLSHESLNRYEVVRLAEKLGKEFAGQFKQLSENGETIRQIQAKISRLETTSDSAATELLKQEADALNFQSEVREKARQQIRQLIAVGLLYQTRPEALEAWLGSHAKTWFFLAETIALTAIFVGVDLAVPILKDHPIEISFLTVMETTLKSLGISFSLLGGVIIPSTLTRSLSTQNKFGAIFESFLKGAGLAGGLDLTSKKNSFRYMNYITRELRYPAQFLNCAMKLRKLSK